jgi:hypothetical protein
MGSPLDRYSVSWQVALIFLPTFIAGIRLHRNRTAIFVLNLIMLVGIYLATGTDFFWPAWFGVILLFVFTIVVVYCQPGEGWAGIVRLN